MKLKNLSLQNYLNSLASTKPAPGGGSASAVVVSLGVGLGEMVSGILLKRKTVTRKTELRRIQSELKRNRRKIDSIIDRDGQAFSRVMKAYGLEKTNPKRKDTVDKRLGEAFDVMEELCALTHTASKLLCRVEKFGSASIMNDLKLGHRFLKAGFYGAYHTADVNVVCVFNSGKRKQLEKRLKKWKQGLK